MPVIINPLCSLSLGCFALLLNFIPVFFLSAWDTEILEGKKGWRPWTAESDSGHSEQPSLWSQVGRDERQSPGQVNCPKVLKLTALPTELTRIPVFPFSSGKWGSTIEEHSKIVSFSICKKAPNKILCNKIMWSLLVQLAAPIKVSEIPF